MSEPMVMDRIQQFYEAGQCIGGYWCQCCGALCDCGCRDDCRVWKWMVRRYEAVPGMGTPYAASDANPDDRDEYEREAAPLLQEDRR